MEKSAVEVQSKETGGKQEGAESKNQLDTVSPATRLLEKRRQMYEKQEEYENKKKEAKQAELGFKVKENDLRQANLEMEEQMIKFSVFL